MKKITRQNRLTKEELLVDESIFAVQNGLIGLRGNFCEGYQEESHNQTLINGFYNNYDYHFEENSPMFPQSGERIVNVVDGQTIHFSIDDTPINMKSCSLINLERTYDLKNGNTLRKALYLDRNHNQFLLTEEKMASMVEHELAIIRLSLKSFEFEGEIVAESFLSMPLYESKRASDSRINKSGRHDLIFVDKAFEDGIMSLHVKTSISNLFLYVSQSHDVAMEIQETAHGYLAKKHYHIKKGETISLTKYLTYTPSTLAEDYEQRNLRLIRQVINKGYSHYKNRQSQYYHDFWKRNLVEILEDEESTVALQYSVFQLDASCYDDHRFGIPAKGLSGEGYEGHYFWDTEIYVIPYFSLTNPEKAKQLLLHRYFDFPLAKEEALRLGVDSGVKIPWRTISGKEISPYFLAGSAQLHINSDIAYSVIQYYNLTKDEEFMNEYGFEMLLETARFMYASGNYHGGMFHLNGVTGPDEYTTQVNDNYYTNSMTKFHFEWLVKYYVSHKEALHNKLIALKVSEEEIEHFNEASKKMTLLFDDALQVVVQDQSFMQKQLLDLKRIPKDNFPLLLHYHPTYIYKHQVLKQADVLLSMFLLDYQNLAVMKKTFDFYFDKTTHDSSLSKCIHSIVMAKIGKVDDAYRFFEEVLEIDLANTHKNTEHGLHIANHGGAYLDLMFGFLGLRIKDNMIHISPVLPKKIKGYKTKFYYQEIEVEIEVSDKLCVNVSHTLTMGIYNEIVKIDKSHCNYIEKE